MSTESSGDSEYESDTGPRDNPRCSNFENNEPVKNGFECTERGSNIRALNRKGRAICRIVSAHGWTLSQIMHIFRVPEKPISKALKNLYSPNDDTGKDYDFVDAEFRKKFPPLKYARGHIVPSPSINTGQDPSGDGGDDPSNSFQSNSTLKRPLANENQGTWHLVKKPRYDYLSQAPHPLPHQFFQPKHSPELLSFLKDVRGLDLSKHVDLFIDRGLQDVAALRLMATWERAKLEETLAREFMGSAEKLAGRKGLTALEVISLELAIRALSSRKTA
ncbi:hypothetical protein B0H17DRAFT_1083353 [Mycena rosella]|uniref:Uncharacterized protein n=1 Tax=Mycena rosella TaxID=1033263 RepID=A0AAD7D0J4_MYCRO|nr:hypothetical protein B0H17DRAFT_1083353 [Mycena rosella]